MSDLQTTIESAFENRANLTTANAEPRLRKAVDEVLARLDAGTLRVAEKRGGEWITHQWVKKAVLLSFRLDDNALLHDGYTRYYDKVPAKFASYSNEDFRAGGFRVVPPAAVPLHAAGSPPVMSAARAAGPPRWHGRTLKPAGRKAPAIHPAG